MKLPHAALVIIAATLLVFTIACDDEKSAQGPATVTSEPATTPTGDGAAFDDLPGDTRLTSNAFENNGAMQPIFTCEGHNFSPPLTIAGVPGAAASLALTTVDADGPGGGFVHWTVYNIDPATTDVPEDTVPGGGIEGQTSLGDGGYFGPCPPSGVHHYVFTLYALDTTLTLDPATAGLVEIEDAMQGHILDQFSFAGTYSRQTTGATP